MKKYYYLFGEEVSRLYYEVEFEEFLKTIRDNNETLDWQLFKYDESIQKPDELLSASIGWMNFARLDENEFNQLNQLKQK